MSALPLFCFTFCIAIPVAQESRTTREFAASGAGAQPLLKGYCILKMKPPGRCVTQVNGACWVTSWAAFVKNGVWWSQALAFSSKNLVRVSYSWPLLMSCHTSFGLTIN